MPRPGCGRRSRLDVPSVVAVAVLLAALALVLVTDITSPLKDDVAWLLYVARRWLAGGRLYQDIVEVNPPLIVWIYALPAAAAGWLGVAPKTISAPFFAAVALGSAWWTADLLAGRAALFARRLPSFGAIGAVLLLMPGVEFGQREHLLVAAALPYLALFARSLQGEAEPRTTAVLAGALAGLGCALKPGYLLAFGLLEAVGWLRGARPCRIASISAAAALGLYALGVLIFCPAFLQNAVPLALALYGATDTPCRQILAESQVLLSGVGVAVLVAAGARQTLPRTEPFLRALLIGLAAFALGATVSYVLESKNWFYHRLPASITAVLALLLWGVAVLRERPRPTLCVIATLALGIDAFGKFVIADYWRLTDWVEAAVAPNLSTEVRLERLVRRERAQTYIAFSEWIALGFPVVNDTGVTWASRFDSMWALRGELWRARLDGAAPREWPIRTWISRDFVAVCPDLAVVDTREGINYVAVLSASSPAFAEAWSRYHQIAAFRGLRVLQRDAAGCTAPLPPRPPRKVAAMVTEPP
jgi:hypothetical protein